VKLYYYADTDSLHIDLADGPSVTSREVIPGVVLVPAASRIWESATNYLVSGTPSPRQIFLARIFETSEWRGTASTAPVAGFIQSE